MKKRIIIAAALSLSMLSSIGYAKDQNSNNAQKTAKYFNTIKTNPEALQVFLNKMPKGGDLHNHIDGAVYAENLIQYSANENYCLHPKIYEVYKDPNCPKQDQLQNIPYEPALYDRLIDNWSMRNFPINTQSGQKHFFAVFPKIEALVVANLPKVIAGIANRAARQHEIYLELMIGGMQLKAADEAGKNAMQIGAKVKPEKDLKLWREKLLKAGINELVQDTNTKMTTLKQQVNKDLQCGSAAAKLGCQVTLRYQYFTLRDLPLPQFYVQLVTAFAVAKSNPDIVGINIVEPENWQMALKQYTKQMQMIGILHSLYPKVNITLHAGELAFGQVPAKDLDFHIRQAINIAQAQRIGHGVDIAYENNAQQLLKEMARKHIDVEINLTSNQDVLGIVGNKHALPLYLKNHVPISLSTDDEGIERTDLTREFKRAVLTYALSYPTLKRIARNSITYSFLPGESLWENPETFVPDNACKNVLLGSMEPSSACSEFLNHNQKAKLQWKLEKQFNNFEKHW